MSQPRKAGRPRPSPLIRESPHGCSALIAGFVVIVRFRQNTVSAALWRIHVREPDERRDKRFGVARRRMLERPLMTKKVTRLGPLCFPSTSSLSTSSSLWSLSTNRLKSVADKPASVAIWGSPAAAISTRSTTLPGARSRNSCTGRSSRKAE